MIAKVIKKFRDKNTKEIFAKGAEYEGTDERVAELQKLGYLEKPKANKKEKKEGE